MEYCPMVTHYTDIQHIAENKKYTGELSTVIGSIVPQIIHKYV